MRRKTQKKQVMSFRLSPKERKALKMIARLGERPVSEVLRELIRERAEGEGLAPDVW